MALFDLPPAQRRLLDFMEALPQCPHGCHFGYVYNSPTFRVPSADDTIDDQVGEIIDLYEREAAGTLQRHLAEDHQDPDAFLAFLDQAHRVIEADRAAAWERIRRDADAIAAQLTETLIPADLRAAGIRIEWEAER